MEERLIKELSAIFKDNVFEVVRLPLKKPMDKLSMYAKYNATETLEVDGEQLKFSWLPWLADQTEEHYSHLLDSIKKAVAELRHNRARSLKKGIALGA